MFETILIVDGRPVEAEAHLERLAGSVEALYGAPLPPEAHVAPSPGPRGLRRLRLTLRPGPAGIACLLEGSAVPASLPFPAPENGAELRSTPLPGGLGPHKWADRSALPQLDGEAVPLLLDDDGAVLEAAWANVFAVHGSALHTPPADGRLLPGVTRAAVLAIAAEEGLETIERPLLAGDLTAASEVFLTGSIRGVVPARSLDGEELGAGPFSTRIGRLLRRRWGLETRSRQSPPAPSAVP